MMMECPEEAAGRDLFSPIGAQGNLMTDPAYYCESYLPVMYGADPLRGIITGEWKYIRSPQPELYRISGDPAETVNLYSQKSEMARALDDRLAEIIRRGRRHSKNNRSSQSEADAGTLKKLESLGYIGGVSPKKAVVSDTGLDPKTIIGYHMNHIRVKMIFSQPDVSPEDLRRGEIICREMLANQPDLWPAPHYLGWIYVKMGNNRLGQKNITGAMDCFSRAIEFNRNQMEAHNNLAWIMATHPDSRYRNGDRAVEYAEKAVSLGKGENPSLLGTLAAAHAETGQFDRAVMLIEKILYRSDIDTYGALVDLWKGQLKMYENRHPYRDPGLK
jgi:tetratricopeptide (TPR) repeat protein